jgi:hypothetical protein
VERLVALGGDLELILPDGPERPLGMRAWVPDHLEPVVESGAGADLGVR